MPNPTDPPHPALETNPQAAFSAYGWDSTDGVIDGSGIPVFAWLNQTGSSGKTASVYWEFGTAAQAGTVAVLAIIPQTTYDTIKDGSYSTNTGLVTYGGNEYCFRFEMDSGVAVMKRLKV